MRAWWKRRQARKRRLGRKGYVPLRVGDIVGGEEAGLVKGHEVLRITEVRGPSEEEPNGGMTVIRS